MNYFKDTKNNIFAYDDEQVRQGYSKDLTLINATQLQSFKLFGVWDKTQAEIDAQVAELEAQAKITDAKKALQSLCDKKSIQAKTFIAGKDVTTEQLARYEEKYQVATEYKTNGNYANVLQLEADLQGITVNELADLIIVRGNVYKQALIEFNARIEAFRVAVYTIINAGDIDRANTIINGAKDFDNTTTDDDVAELFK